MAQTFGEVVYMVLDQLKLLTDDSIIGEDHIIMLIDKYRAFLLKLKYQDVRKLVNYLNYQILYPYVSFSSRTQDYVLMKSEEKIPLLLNIGIVKTSQTFPMIDYGYTYVDRNRFPYTGINKYLKNITYSTIADNDYLYLKSGDSQIEELDNICIRAVFSSSTQALLFIDNNIDILNQLLPLEDALVNVMIEMITKELIQKLLLPLDIVNNENDDVNPSMNSGKQKND